MLPTKHTPIKISTLHQYARTFVRAMSEFFVIAECGCVSGSNTPWYQEA